VLALLAAVMMVDSQSELPVGVIEPYSWGSNTIPVHGKGVPGTEVVDAAVIEAMRKDGIVGCGVCICKGDTILYRKGFGYSELPNQPFLPTTSTRCGSLAKSITSLCALVLMDKGLLKLDEKVLPILASIGIVPTPIDERVSQIRVRDLMDHTSGLPAGATYTSWRPNRNLIEALKLDQKPTSKDVVLDALSTSKLLFEPGTSFEYANANYVILARIVEAKSKMSFNEYLTKVAMPKFGVAAGSIFVSKDQISPEDPARGITEAAYYQTTTERYESFLPEDTARGKVFGEAYRGYSTECADGAGGISISADGLARIIANLDSRECSLSAQSVREILTPPAYYKRQKGFDPSRSGYYSKGLIVRYSGGQPWFSHGGMTQHCGGVIGYNAGYQFAAVSNWNSVKAPNVDSMLDHALGQAVGKIVLR